METAMPSAMLILVGCQLLGELLRTTFHLPVPGPVIGMFLLTLALGIRAKRIGQAITPAPLKPVAEGLIANMGLLFVPAGVGIIAEAGVIRKEWLPIIVAVAGSTILSLIVTALVMHWTLPRTPANPAEREGSMS
ncbi:CidA/LrgA family protein [Gluconacetobacter sp.]|uniref:CidA/LrgA family protein n=1 Tax=Gluconacetobacter sp. TaxID=1935994 RepID=UPI0039E7A5A9